MSEEPIPQEKFADWMAWPQLARTAVIGAGIGGVMLGLILGYSMGLDYGKKSAVNLSSISSNTSFTSSTDTSAISTSNLVFGKWRKTSGTCPDYLTLALSDSKLSYISSSTADGAGTEYKEQIQSFTDSSVTTQSGSSTFLYSVSNGALVYSFNGASCAFDRLN